MGGRILERDGEGSKQRERERKMGRCIEGGKEGGWI